MALCAIYCCATADTLTKLLQQCFLFFIVVVIPGHNLVNSQVSVNRIIGPTLVILCVATIKGDSSLTQSKPSDCLAPLSKNKIRYNSLMKNDNIIANFMLIPKQNMFLW